MKTSVRIGCAGGFWGDSVVAMEQLATKGDVDYIVSDYLAELTLAILAKAKDRDPAAGYATDFVGLTLKPILGELLRRKIRVVVNAGGMNPSGCAAALRALADKLQLKLRVGVVEGDDLMPRQAALRAQDTREMFTGEPLPVSLTSMNAYLGALPIAAALSMGADIVVTGRCVDSALVLGPLIHEFGWKADEFDRLAGGSLAGHIVECGTQTTGGLFTDWRPVGPRDEMGFPIAECLPDGSFYLTKPEGTGGLITPHVVAEQMLYEVGDPRNYLLPDVTVDIGDVRIEQAGPNRVRLSGARGRAPTASYKVSAIYLDGYRSTATLTMIGRDAGAKAQMVAEAFLVRTRRLMRDAGFADYSETHVEVLGTEVATYGPHARIRDTREVVLRIAVRHSQDKALQIFAREIAPFGTAGTPGTTGFGGRPKPTPVYRLFSFLVPKIELTITATVDTEAVRVDPSTTQPWGPPVLDDPLRYPPFVVSGPMVRRPLRAIAIARSGDKADIAHMALIARHPDFHSLLRHAMTPQAVAEYLAHLVKGKVERYDVPGIHAVNFLLHEGLAGGGTASLRSDALGKAFGEIMLDHEIDIPESWLEHPALGR